VKAGVLATKHAKSKVEQKYTLGTLPKSAIKAVSVLRKLLKNSTMYGAQNVY